MYHYWIEAILIWKFTI